MLIAVLSGFVLAIVAPLLHARVGNTTGWLLGLFPLTLLAWFASHVPAVAEGARFLEAHPWVPSLDIGLSFLLDGLSLVFALMISGIGTFILIYSGRYLEGHPALGRFYLTMLAFMASMLGLVLSDNLITLFVFWELTSVTSYLLIGFNHEDLKARRSALQGLFVTVAGGLALLAGLIMLGLIHNSFELSQILDSNQMVHQHPWFIPLLLCILVGCFTKSAQVPFHFWLPNAMVAPTPVSAFLHSATMVKAGVYLLARLSPVFSDSGLWMLLLTGFGSATMVTGALMAISHTDVKRVLAYSTVSALGMLVMLIGVGTPAAMVAFATVLVAHSLYKGALFMIAGVLDHATGTRDLSRMGGLAAALPVTAAIAAVAGLSFAGLPPLLGFIGKELVLEAVLSAPQLQSILTLLSVITGIGVMVAAALVSVKPFWGAPSTDSAVHHGPHPALLAGPAVMAGLSLLLALFPKATGSLLVAPVVSAMGGSPDEVYLALWHGVNLPLLLTILSVVVALVLFRVWSRAQPTLALLRSAAARIGPEAAYDRLMVGLTRTAAWQTRVLQNGVMGNYLITLALTTVVAGGFTLLSQHGMPFRTPSVETIGFPAGIAVLTLIGAVFASVTRSRMAAVASTGVMGFGVALIFVLFSAPDLGITQLLIETLTVMLLVLVLVRLPGFTRLSSIIERGRDLTVAVLFGALMTALTLAVTEQSFFEPISAEMVARSVPDAHGRNIVNVILVDYRALDTLGEIFVLALAAIGVYAMIHLKAEDHRP